MLKKDGADMKPKYGNKKVTYKGKTFDSVKEKNRYAELEMLERGGVIFDLCCQVKFELLPSQKDIKTGKVIERPVYYVADFVYKKKLPNGGVETVVEDTKGFKTDAYILKRKMMFFLKGIKISEV